MAGEEFRLDGRDLATALLDSRGCPPTLLGDFVEGASIALQRRLLSREALPAGYRDVDILRFEFEAVAHAARGLRGRQGCSASEKGIVHHLAAPGVVQNRTSHQLDWLLRRMIVLLLV